MVKLADFGIAKAAEESDITKVGSVLGTAAYLAPEQARGEPAGPPSDLYALGVVAYQLLAGRLPYDAASLTDLARQQETGPPPRLDEVDPDVPPALAPPSRARCIATREQRYADAAEMETALRDGLRGRAPAGATERDLGAPRTRRRRGCSPAPSRHRARARRRRRRAPHRRLEPLDEPAPRRAPRPPRRPRRRRASSKRGVAARGCSSACCVVLALVAAGIVGYQALRRSAARSPCSCARTSAATSRQRVDELRELIDDNTQ